ncbi:DUF1289 domain-containing protein [Catenovulum sp. 2E275]|uniref:DUF1289 domain-containing protein n=1 Tax=Catenovulum sp. 2E275 TaxID=2980497 RepID=UPI0021D12EEE|nr:DUF1289 domain-containing protein [Catenovulum sp. 2E275]MCU4674278.1 DUF1289 domain-containing protein [Catenovulum sp. 2E275]
MQQDKLFELEEIDSPCIGVCESGARGYCKGCLRSREERQYWYQLSTEQKIKVISLCQLRQKKLNTKKRKQQEEALLAEIKNEQLDLF